LAATAGLAADEHIPNVGMQASPTSVITPVGAVADTLAPLASKTAGASPHVHFTCAPVQTSVPIIHPRLNDR
jgi:hypothetical protein